MRSIRCALLGALFVSASMQALACYTVYDKSNRVIWQSEASPVDMSRPLHETVPARFPGGHMIFDTVSNCPQINVVIRSRGTSATTSPLLTDETTARSMGLPHVTLASGVALVRPGEAAMRPGVTVVPTEEAVAVAARRLSRDTVITEYRDPPVTIVETAPRSDPAEATRAMGAGPARYPQR